MRSEPADAGLRAGREHHARARLVNQDIGRLVEKLMRLTGGYLQPANLQPATALRRAHENHGLEAESTKQGRIETNGTLRMVRGAEKKFSRVFAFFSVR